MSEIRSKVSIGVRVKYPLCLSDFNETRIFLNRFLKNSQMPNFMKILSVGAESIHANGQAWRR